MINTKKSIIRNQVQKLREHVDLYKNVMDHCKNCDIVVECSMDRATWQPGGWCHEISSMINEYVGG